MVDWASVRAFTEASCAEIFDVTPCEAIATKPGLSGNHPREDDPSRPGFPFFGTIDLQPPGDLLRRHEPSDPASPGKAVSYDAVLTAHVGEWPWMLKKLDRVRAGGETWEVQASEKDGSNRPAFYLTRMRNARG